MREILLRQARPPSEDALLVGRGLWSVMVEDDDPLILSPNTIPQNEMSSAQDICDWVPDTHPDYGKRRRRVVRAGRSPSTTISMSEVTP